MKKILLFLAMIFALTNCANQNKINQDTTIFTQITKTENREVATYDAISVGGSFDIVLTEENQNRIQIIAEEKLLPHIITDVKDKTLEIKIKPINNVINQSKQNIKVYIPAKNINKITISGAVMLISSYTLNPKNLSINTSGAGNVSLNINVKNLLTSLSGAGILTLTGKAEISDINTRGAGKLDASGLISEKLVLSSSGASKVQAQVSQSLVGNVSGASDVQIKGSSKSTLLNISGASKLDASKLISEKVNAETYGSSKLKVYTSQSFEGKASNASKIQVYGNPTSVISSNDMASKIKIEK